MRKIVLFLLLLPLAACGLFANKELRTLRKSPDYRAGYQDGCNSAWGPDANKRQTTPSCATTSSIRTTAPIMWAGIAASMPAAAPAIAAAPCRARCPAVRYPIKIRAMAAGRAGFNSSDAFRGATIR